MKPRIDYTLYLVTDEALMSASSLEEALHAAARGGVTLVQIREKNASHDEFVRKARQAKAVLDDYGIPLIVNDAVDVALEAGAAGVHIGQKDMPAREARALIGPDMVLGVSAATRDEALVAQAAGADYLGIGAVVPTTTKRDTRPVTIDELAAIRAAVGIPCVAIGGLNTQNVGRFAGLGLDGFAVVSAIMAAADTEAAAHSMRKAADEALR